jgi:hypothetical protein
LGTEVLEAIYHCDIDGPTQAKRIHIDDQEYAHFVIVADETLLNDSLTVPHNTSLILSPIHTEGSSRQQESSRAQTLNTGSFRRIFPVKYWGI